MNLSAFELSADYVNGCHVVSTYTVVAHYSPIEKMFKVSILYLVADDDSFKINIIEVQETL